MDRFAQRATERWWFAGIALGVIPIVFASGLGLSGCGAERFSSMNVSRSGHGWAVTVLCATLLTLLLLVRRRRALGQAIRPILALPTIPLSKAAGELVEIRARVHPRAPTVPGAMTALPRAWWRLVVREVYKSGKNTHTVDVLNVSSTEGVPIMDESAEGLLDLRQAHLDVRAVGFSYTPFDKSPEAQRVGTRLAARDGHIRFIVEERFLEPNEELYVLGHVERIHDASGESSYRGAASKPLVQGKSEGSLFVHAGSERSILRELRWERAASTLTVFATAILAVAFVTMQVWLASR
jgi:hypothetical protein